MRHHRHAAGAPCLLRLALFVVAGLAGVMLVGEVPATPEVVTRYLAVDRLGLFFDVVICVGAGLSALLAGGYLREHGLDGLSAKMADQLPEMDLDDPYHRAVIDGLEIPGEWPEIRVRLEAEVAAAGPENLHQRLVDVDVCAARQQRGAGG